MKAKEKKMIELKVTYHNKKVFVFYGKTKKECNNKFKAKFGNFKGFVKREYIEYTEQFI